MNKYIKAYREKRDITLSELLNNRIVVADVFKGQCFKIIVYDQI